MADNFANTHSVMEAAPAPQAQGVQVPSPNWRRVASLIALAMALFHLYAASVGVYPELIQRGAHLGFVLVLIFLLHPRGRLRVFGIPVMDLLLALLAIMVAYYLLWNFENIPDRYGNENAADVIIGTLTVALVLEGTRRTVGWPLTLIASVFLVYAYFGPYMPGLLIHRGYPIPRLASHLSLAATGIFGIPLGVSATIVILFIIFGAFLTVSGAGSFFIDLATGLTGRSVGGPAKAAVVSSSLMGTVSGSAVANVATTGTFTIPLMKRTGYPPHIAGAVEAVASTGGQLMPPVMGAAAFIMSELTDIPYLKIALAATIPAVLYYAAAFFYVHLEAKRLQIKSIPPEERPNMLLVLRKGGHLLLPLCLLIYLLFRSYSPIFAAYYAILALVAVSYLRRETRMGPRAILKALEEGAIGTLGVAAACACAGIVIGVLSLTGLGIRLSSILITLAQGNLPVLLVLTMGASIILGMGLPTSACYVLLAALGAPALTKVGVDLLAAHFFIFYFGIISCITPPVAMASYAGAALADADPSRVGFAAVKIGLVGFIVPYMFVYSPVLLGQGSLWEVGWALTTALIGCAALAAALQGYLLAPCKLPLRLLLAAAALILIAPGWVSDIGGLVLVGGCAAIQRVDLVVPRFISGWGSKRADVRIDRS